MIICRKKHLLTTLKENRQNAGRVTNRKAAGLHTNWDIVGLHHCCSNTHFWEPNFKSGLFEPQTALHGLFPLLYLIQTPVTKIRWSVKTAKRAYVTSMWTSDADRGARLASSPTVTKNFNRNLEIFVQFIKKEMLLCYCSCQKGWAKAWNTLYSTCNTQCLSDLQPYPTYDSNLHTDSSQGGRGWKKRKMDYGGLSAELQLLLSIAITERLPLQIRKNTHSGNRSSQDASAPSTAFLSAFTKTHMNRNYFSTNSSFLNLSQDWSNSCSSTRFLLVTPKAWWGTWDSYWWGQMNQ